MKRASTVLRGACVLDISALPHRIPSAGISLSRSNERCGANLRANARLARHSENTFRSPSSRQQSRSGSQREIRSCKADRQTPAESGRTGKRVVRVEGAGAKMEAWEHLQQKVALWLRSGQARRPVRSAGRREVRRGGGNWVNHFTGTPVVTMVYSALFMEMLWTAVTQSINLSENGIY